MEIVHRIFTQLFIYFFCRSSEDEPKSIPKANVNLDTSNNTSGGSADLLGLGIGGSAPAPEVSNLNGNGFTQEPPTNNLSK